MSAPAIERCKHKPTRATIEPSNTEAQYVFKDAHTLFSVDHRNSFGHEYFRLFDSK
jgi:hypothetical protein